MSSFGLADYLIFSATLLLSSVIGIYHAIRSRKKLSTEEYVLASKSIAWFPIFVSMAASFFSAVGVMGYPAQIYSSGITFSLTLFNFLFPITLCAEVVGPLFRKLQLVSVNQYLEMRFSSGIRYLGCFFLPRSVLNLLECCPICSKSSSQLRCGCATNGNDIIDRCHLHVLYISRRHESCYLDGRFSVVCYGLWARGGHRRCSGACGVDERCFHHCLQHGQVAHQLQSRSQSVPHVLGRSDWSSGHRVCSLVHCATHRPTSAGRADR